VTRHSSCIPVIEILAGATTEDRPLKLSKARAEMDLEPLSDESLLRYYEAIRTQIVADFGTEGHRFVGQKVQDRAQALLAEIRRRRLDVTPINWHF
jgi:hypothetical protein